ncbi:hypothetical protein H6G27_33730 [Nostoc linckia FACHB-104]|nr:hypothetical protein [Nostoc linckia FACHB-104]
MKRETLVIGLLEEYWADECDAAGLTNVQDIVEGKIQYESAEGASYIDLVTVLTVLVAATEFVKNAIDIYETLKKQKNKNPEDTELKAEMKNKQLEPDDIDEITRNNVYKYVCKKLEQEDLEEE